MTGARIFDDPEYTQKRCEILKKKYSKYVYVVMQNKGFRKIKNYFYL